jgi:crotonobetainyl-CoA:carnitine CoA-transferase CaiB-like acyl-CoA transferase
MTVRSTAGEKNATAPPLSGVRVLDFTHIVAGPFGTRILADLGAEVLHVETQTRSEGVGVHVGRRDVRVDRNKRSITLNLKHDAGRATAIRLASVADVIVENFSAGVMARLGLAYGVLQPANPGLIYVSMSGFGHTGPRRDWTSMNMNLQGYSGLMLVTGREGDPPTPISNSWNDFIASLHAAFAILQALLERKRTGQGRFLDLAQAECSIATLGGVVLAAVASGQDPPRLGNRSTAVAPQGVYACAGTDQWCAISVQTDQQWQALCGVMGKPTLAADARFASVIGRLRHHDEIDEPIRAWTREHSKEAVQSQLAAAGVPAERVRHADAVVNSEDSGQVFKWVDVPGLGKPDLAAGLPFALSRSQTFEPESPPVIGAHTRPALREWIGLSDAEIDQLDAAGALI